MKITYQWLNDFAPLASSPAEVAAQLTMAGLEVESIEPVAPPFTQVVVGKVLECTRHPDAEKLSVCQVTTDGSNRLQIICGASNVRAGLTVAVAQVGAKLPKDVSIGRARLRGLESHGMLCSARELGLGDEHEGIMELDADLTLNEDLRSALKLNDSVLEVNATPNRGDCMSVFGIARDYVAARERRYLNYPSTAVPAHAGQTATFPVSLESPGCPVFACRVMRGVKADARAPAWLRERLRRVGLNSISAIVDVTNYVMMELGQPLHAYDLSKLAGGIVVRQATSGERITLLDDKEYELNPEFLVISDASGPVGLAGIMGGRPTAISATTTEVLLEAAYFTPDAVAGRARRLGLFTDAGQRYERGVDPKLAQVAIERATALLLACAGGEAGPVQVSRLAGDAAATTVALRRARLARLLGAQVPDSDVRAVLSSISESVQDIEGGWRISRPSHRFDVKIEADLIEEVARLRGFEQIAETHAVVPQIAGSATETTVAPARILHSMVARGYAEAITYTFVDPATQRLLFPDSAVLTLSNPISSDLAEMRVSLLPGLLQVVRDNMRRQQSRVRLFEIGKKFQVQGSSGELAEVESLAGVVAGSRWPEQWGAAREAVDFYDVKADIENILGLTGPSQDVDFVAATLPCLRPGRAAQIVRGALPIGWLGELHPQLVKTFNLPTTVFLFELDVALAFASKPLQFIEISKFPSVRRDLAIVVDESVPLAVLRENVSVSASGLLRELRVFDVYRGPGIEIGRKSVALGLILQDSSRTLTDVDADAAVAQVVARLRDVLSATIRDQ